MDVAIMHHAPDSEPGTLVACGKTVDAALDEDAAVISGPIEDFLKGVLGQGIPIPDGVDRCSGCLKEIKAKIAADAAPPQSNVQTAALPKSKAGAGPDQSPR